MKELIKIQSELKAPKGQRNNFGNYNYRSCEDILEALKPILKDNKCTLTLNDEVKEVGGIIFIDATATISNGTESVSVKAQAGINPNRKGMDIAQSFGSSSSYARKYALNGLFAIDDTKDADSMDNRAVQAPQKQYTAKDIQILADKKKIDAVKICEAYKVLGLAQLSQENMNKVYKQLESK